MPCTLPVYDNLTAFITCSIVDGSVLMCKLSSDDSVLVKTSCSVHVDTLWNVGSTFPLFFVLFSMNSRFCRLHTCAFYVSQSCLVILYTVLNSPIMAGYYSSLARSSRYCLSFLILALLLISLPIVMYVTLGFVLWPTVFFCSFYINIVDAIPLVFSTAFCIIRVV